MTNNVATALSNATVNTKVQFINSYHCLTVRISVPFIEKVDMDGDDGQIETVEETSK